MLCCYHSTVVCTCSTCNTGRASLLLLTNCDSVCHCRISLLGRFGSLVVVGCGWLVDSFYIHRILHIRGLGLSPTAFIHSYSMKASPTQLGSIYFGLRFAYAIGRVRCHIDAHYWPTPHIPWTDYQTPIRTGRLHTSLWGILDSLGWGCLYRQKLRCRSCRVALADSWRCICLAMHFTCEC